jgi:SAM-dependent methyltransferase
VSETPALDPRVAAYYERAPEERRLLEGPARLEFARTCELIGRLAPPPPAIGLDVGGGPGRYAGWLAERGYEVYLIDPVARLVEEARRAPTAVPIAGCMVGDARGVEWSDGSAALVLLLGPLYHLQHASDRASALAESFRVLRPGGVVFAAGISRFASVLDGLSRGLLRDPEFARIVGEDLLSGRHQNPTSRLDYFTTAYFHHPHDLGREVADAGFELRGVYGIEGPGWLLPDFDSRWADPDARDALLGTARLLETEPTVLGVSAHLLAVGRKPG